MNRCFFKLAAATISLLLSHVALAETSFIYQGQLQQDGAPFAGSADLAFELFDAPIDGDPVGSVVTHEGWPVEDGLFQVELDFGAVFDGSPLYLEVRVNDTPLTPRQSIRPAPYALFALDGAGGSPWQLDGTSIHYSEGNVGIGTDDPSAPLQVVGRGVLGESSNVASGEYSFVAGGSELLPNMAGGDRSFVGGGINNTAAGDRSFVGGGANNTAGGPVNHDDSFVAGGVGNSASGVRSFVGGGFTNTASGGNSFVGSGFLNSARGANSFVASGFESCAGGNVSFAGGRRAKVRPASDPGSGVCSGLPSYPGGHGDAGTFVWADNTDADFVSTGTNQFLIRASGGIGIGTNEPQSQLDVRNNTRSSTLYAENSLMQTDSVAVHGETSMGVAVFGRALEESGTTYGVRGDSASSSGAGVFGQTTSNQETAAGVRGQTAGSIGVHGHATNSTGVNRGVFGQTNSNLGYAGYFVGGRNYFEGNVGIGNAAPGDRLHINADADQNALRVLVGPTTRFRVYGTGGVGIGTNMISSPPAGGDLAVSGAVAINVTGNDPSPWRLAVNGVAAKTGGGEWSVFSDARLKHDIAPIGPGMLDRLLTLNGYTFRYHDDAVENRLALPGEQIGLLAHEVAEVFPDWVDADDEGYLYVTARGTTAMFIEALRELRTENNRKLAELRAEKDREIARLRQQLDEQRDDMGARLAALERLLDVTGFARAGH